MFSRKSTEITRRGDWFDPFAALTRWTSEFDRLFEETGWPAFRLRGITRSTAWSPNLDVFEKDNRVIVRADLPGLTTDDIKVEVIEGYLTIAGERKTEAEENKENFYRCEREYGSFYRAFPLPDGVDVGNVTATFENDVLEVTVPLQVCAEVTPRTIAIEEPAKGAHAKKAA